MRDLLSLNTAARVNKYFADRTPRRQHLIRLLHKAGPRPVLEALIEVNAGHEIDAVLERFASIPPQVYQEIGADRLAIDSVAVFNGGRS
jgi:hypothetical protein